MSQVVIYTKDRCPQCIGAKMFLKSKGLDFEERNVSNNEVFLEEARATGLMGAPIIIAENTSVGAFSGNNTIKLNQIHHELTSETEDK